MNLVSAATAIGLVLAALSAFAPQVAASTATGGCSPPSGTGPFTCTANGVYTPAAGISCANVEAVGGGGGGGNSAADNGGGSGGAGGGYAKSAIAVTSGTPYTVQVGGGGAGGAAGTGTAENPGAAGGDSWFGSPATILAKGGGGGLGGDFTTVVAGGAPGAGNIGTTVNSGGAGGDGAAYDASPKASGGGGGGGGASSAGGAGSGAAFGAGASPGGNGASGRVQTGNGFGAGLAGATPGGGGGGGLASAAAPNYDGGAGAPGQVVITEYSTATGSTVVASPTSILANGASPSTITVTLQTPCGVVAGNAVSLASSMGAADTITPATATTNGSGQATFTLTTNTCGARTLTATDTTTSTTLASTASVVAATTTGATAGASTITVTPSTVYATGYSTGAVTVTLLTPAGCPVAGKTVTLASSRGALDTITTVNGVTGNDGTATFTISSTDYTTNGGVSVLTATDVTDGFVVTPTATVTFVPFSGTLTFTTPPTYLRRDLPFLPVVTVKATVGGVPQSGIPITLTLTGTAGAHLQGGPGQNVNGVTTPAPVAFTNSLGLARFPGLSIDQVGTYQLGAAAGTSTTTSASFQVGTTMPDWAQGHRDASHSGMAPAPGDLAGQSATSLAMAGGDIASVQVADLDLDGWLDVVAINGFDTVNGAMTVYAYKQDPVTHALNLYWSTPIPIPSFTGLGEPPLPGTSGFGMVTVGPLVANNPTPYVVVLFNNVQGTVATVNTAQLMVMRATDGTILGQIASSIPIFGLAPVIGDVTGEGTPDMVYVANEGSTGNGYDVSAARLDPTQAIGSQVISQFQTAITLDVMAAGPVLGELRSSHAGLEVVVASETTLYLCRPSTVAANCSESVATSPVPAGLAIGDIDADARPEIIVNAVSGTSVSVIKGTAATLGTASARVEITATTGDLSNTPTLGDSNGDGRTDILEAQATGGGVGLVGFDGTALAVLGSAAGAPLTTVGGGYVDANYPNNAATGAIVPDFLYSHTAGTAVGWYSLNPLASGASVTTAAAPTSAPALADINGDCRGDLVVGLSGGNVAVYRSTAGAVPSPVSFASPVDFTSLAAWSDGASPGAGIQAKLAWNAPVDGGLPVVRYNIYRATSVGGPYAQVATWWSGTAPTVAAPFIDAVPWYGEYYYKISAVNCLGEGTQSAPFLSQVLLPMSPPSLTGAIVHGATPAYVDPAKVRLTWSPSPAYTARPNGCGPVDTPDTTDGYNVYRRVYPGGSYGTALNGATPISSALASYTANVAGPYVFDDSTAPVGFEYEYQVRAKNCVGEEVATNGVTVLVNLKFPTTPTSITARPWADPAYEATADTHKVKVEWQAPTTANGCGWIEGYRVYRSTTTPIVLGAPTLLATVKVPATWPQGDATTAPANPGSPALLYLDDGSGLLAEPVDGATYYYTVTAVNCVGEQSSGLVENVAAFTVPAAPAAPTGAVTSGPTATITWTAPAGGANNADCNWFEGYRVYRGTNGGAITWLADVRPSTVSAWPRATTPPADPAGTQPMTYADSSLSGATSVTYKVSAVNCTGEGPQSPALTMPIFATNIALSAYIGDATSAIPMANSLIGGTSPFSCTWSSSGGSPAFSPNGDAAACAGTSATFAAAGGPYTITVTATDSSTPTASTATDTATVTVNSALVANILEATASGDTDDVIPLTSTASGGTPTLDCTWSAPAGLTINSPSSCSATTVQSTTPGTYTVTFSVQDDATTAVTVTDTAVVTITGPLDLNIVETGVTGAVNSAIPLTGTTVGGTTPYSCLWASDLGSPAISNNLLCNGAPTFTYTTPGTYTVTHSASDSATVAGSDFDTATITVTAALVANIVEASGSAGQNIAIPFTATQAGGTPGAGYACTWTAPAALSIATPSDCAGTTVQSATPGTYTLTLTVTDSATVVSTATDTATVTVTPPLAVDVIPTTANAVTGNDLAVASSVTGGTTPYSCTWSSVPAATLTGSTCSTVTFNAPGSGSYTLTLSATDSATPMGMASDFVTITVTNALTADITLASASAAASTPIGIPSAVAGGTPGYTCGWSVLPAGPILSAASCNGVTFNAATAGSYTLTLSASDSLSATDTDSIVVTITGPLAVNVVQSTVNGQVGAALALSATQGGGTTPYSCSWTSDGAPAIAASTACAGTTFTFATPGTYVATLTVTDAATTPATVTDTATFVITDALAANIVPTSASGPTGASLSLPSTVTGGTGPVSCTWTSTGAPTITTPTSCTSAGFSYATVGTYTVTLTVMDSASTPVTVFDTASLTITAPLAVDIVAATAAGSIGSPVSLTSTVTGGTPTRTCTWTATGGPTISTPSSCTAAGFTFASAGTYTATLSVTDSATSPATVTDTATITIYGPLSADVTASSITAYTAVAFDIAATTTGGVPSVSCSWSGTGGPSIGATTCTTASLTYGAAGTYTVTFSATDSASTPATATDTVTVNVVNVNTPPTFTAGADVTTAEDIVASLPGWATAISKGAGAWESSQALTFVVTSNSAPTLFASGPTISATGTLSYVPAANAFGTATITVELQDDGGTGGGGDDTSDAATFVITVTPVNDAPIAVNDPSVGPCSAPTGYRVAVGMAFTSPSLQANDEDVDGDTFTSALVGAPPPGTFALSSSGVFTYTAAAAGTTSFQYRNTDSNGATGAPATVNICRVNNLPPVASFAEPPQVQVGEIVPYTSTSTDDFGVVAWQWNFGDSQHANTATVGHAYTDAGVYHVTLTVTDEFGLTHTTSQSITVLYPANPAAQPAPPSPPLPPPSPALVQNGAPTVDVGEDLVVEPGERVELTGTATDPEGNSVTLRWIQETGPRVSLTGATTATASFVAPSGGTMRFRLEADDGNVIAADSLEVSVASPLADITAEPEALGIVSSVREGSLVVTFYASGASGGELVWDFGDGTAPASGTDVRHVYAQPGTYTVTLREAGQATASAQEVVDLERPTPLAASDGAGFQANWLVLGILLGVLVLFVAGVVLVLRRRPQGP